MEIEKIKEDIAGTGKIGSIEIGEGKELKLDFS